MVKTRAAELVEEERKEAEACELWGDFPDSSADLDSRVHGCMVGVLKAVHASLKRTKMPEEAKEVSGNTHTHTHTHTQLTLFNFRAHPQSHANTHTHMLTDIHTYTHIRFRVGACGAKGAHDKP